jgi:tetratricopeptide (TPR) repeat protein
LLNQTRTDINDKELKGRSLFLGIANTMDPGLDPNNVKSDTSFATRHIRSILELNSIMKENKEINLNYAWKYYNDEDHGSVPLITEYDALRFIFNFFKPTITYSQLKDTAFNIELALKSHALKISDKLGYEYLIPEATLNSFGYEFIGLKLLKKAYTIFKMNIEYYPESSNVYDSMGELLMIQGDTAASIEYYEKSLQLNPKNENARTKIKKMKEKYDR